MIQNWVTLSIGCRFNFPQPPMKSANILYALENHMSETKIRNHKDNWKNISKHLNDMKECEDISYDQLLTAMYIASYISKAQKGMSQLLQRACDEARVILA